MKCNGFSMMEMVIVLSIISLGALVAVPPLLSWKRSADVRGLAFQIASSFHLARNYALKYRDLVVINIKNDGYMIFVDNGDSGAVAGDWVRSGTEKLLFTYEAPAGIQLSTNFPADRFRFKGFGRNQPGTVTVQGNGGRTKTLIVVNVLGRIRTELN